MMETPYLEKHPVFRDERGTFCATSLDVNYGSPHAIRQFNVSVSSPRVFRGMHHQLAPFTQSKILTLIRGRIVDFVVSIRPDNFGETFIFEMNPGDRVYVPRDYLHGFYVYDNQEAIVQYMVDNKYDKDSEISIDWKSCPMVKTWVEADSAQWGYDMNSITLSPKDADAISLETLKKSVIKEI